MVFIICKILFLKEEIVPYLSKKKKKREEIVSSILIQKKEKKEEEIVPIHRKCIKTTPEKNYNLQLKRSKKSKKKVEWILLMAVIQSYKDLQKKKKGLITCWPISGLVLNTIT